MMKMILALIKRAVLSFIMDNKEEIKVFLQELIIKIVQESRKSKKA